MIDIHIGLISISLFIFAVVCYKYLRYNYLIVTSAIYDIEMGAILLLSLLNACLCIIILKEHLDSSLLLGVALNYIGIFTLGYKVTTARLKKIDTE